MKAFRSPLYEMEEFEEIRSKLKDNKGVLQVTGCIDSQKSHFIDALSEGYDSCLIVADNELRAKELYENYRFFDREALLLPARDFIFYQADIHSGEIDRQRAAVWKTLAQGTKVTVITTIAAFMTHSMPFAEWKDAAFTMKSGEELDLSAVSKRLLELGYEHASMVEGPGQFAVRGGILDIFSLTDEMPVRVELWGDEIDSIRSFDAASQRSVENMDQVTV